MSGFSLICCVINIGNASKTMKCARKYGVKGGTITIGRGTVHSRLLDFLKMNEVRKEIVTMIVEDELVAEAIKGISVDMAFEKPHHGIAFSYSVAEFTGSTNKVNQKSKISEVENIMHNVIYVVVDKGKAEDVIEAANKAGARGGTIFNARGAGIHEVQKFFSVEIEPEKEVVFIITKTDEKDSIVASIRKELKIDEPGKGIMFILDVKEVYGLHID